MCATDRHDITIAVKVVSNPKLLISLRPYNSHAYITQFYPSPSAHGHSKQRELTMQSWRSLLTSTLHDIPSKLLAAISHTIVEKMDRVERGMNSCAMTIISHWKEYWPSRGSTQRHPEQKPDEL